MLTIYPFYQEYCQVIDEEEALKKAFSFCQKKCRGGGGLTFGGPIWYDKTGTGGRDGPHGGDPLRFPLLHIGGSKKRGERNSAEHQKHHRKRRESGNRGRAEEAGAA